MKWGGHCSYKRYGNTSGADFYRLEKTRRENSLLKRDLFTLQNIQIKIFCLFLHFYAKNMFYFSFNGFDNFQ